MIWVFSIVIYNIRLNMHLFWVQIVIFKWIFWKWNFFFVQFIMGVSHKNDLDTCLAWNLRNHHEDGSESYIVTVTLPYFSHSMIQSSSLKNVCQPSRNHFSVRGLEKTLKICRQVLMSFTQLVLVLNIKSRIGYFDAHVWKLTGKNHPYTVEF